MEEESGLSIPEMISMVWRRKWLLILTSLVLLISALIVVFKIPATYRSTGLILVEQQEIPTQWVNSTISSYADERIQAIGQRVLTTANVYEIIKKYGLYSDETDSSSIDALVAKARDNFHVQNVQAPIRDRNTGRTGAATVAFRISFDDPSAGMAQDIATELVNLYLNENVKSRTKAIVDTRQFLEAEADRLELDLADIEEKLSEFKEKNFGALPEHQALNITAYQRTEQQISDIDRSISTLDERKIILESGIDSARRYIEAGRASSGAPAIVDPAQQRLNELQAEYTNLLTKYSDVHPDLIKLKREISLLESQVGSQTMASSPASNTVANVLLEQSDSSLVRLNTELRSANSEQANLRAKKIELEQKLNDLDALINRTPEVEREYGALIRDYDNIQAKYNDIRTKQSSARVSESLETEQKGERFTLIEPPRLPLTPHKPDRKKMSVLALGIAMAGGAGMIFGVEFLDGRVRNVRALERLSGTPVLAAVGYIENSADRRRRKRKRLIKIFVIALLVAGIAYLLRRLGIGPENIDAENIKLMVKEWMSRIHIPGLGNG